MLQISLNLLFVKKIHNELKLIINQKRKVLEDKVIVKYLIKIMCISLEGKAKIQERQQIHIYLI